MPITGSYKITIYQKKLTNWKKVTEYVLAKGQANNTLLNYKLYTRK